MRIWMPALAVALVVALTGAGGGQLPGDYRDRHCPCRFAGGKVPQGAIVCLAMPGGERLARCEMAENMPTWAVLQQGCPHARAEVEAGLAGL